MEREDKLKLLQGLYWDYHIDPEEYLDILEGRRPSRDWTTRERILLRMLERVYWYTLVDFFGMDGIKELLTPGVIDMLRYPDMRYRYEFVRKVLHGEPVSSSGWNAERREELRHSVLSNRWYRSR